MQRHMLRSLLLIVAWCSFCGASPVLAANLEELTPYLSGQYFTWREYVGGRRVLKETGPLVAAGALAEVLFPYAPPSALTLRGRAELFGGIVDYDGETQGPRIPVKTEVNYIGTRVEYDLGYRYSSAAWNLEPFGGVGYRWWLRMLQDATATDGTRVSGYTESWHTLYARVGGRGNYRSDSGLRFYAEGGAKYPLYTGNSVDFVGSGVTTFRPDAAWSAFAETGVYYGRLRLGLSYEGFRFTPSPVIRVGSTDYFQPESSSDLYGLTIGWAF